jgi:hypothetical protein
MTTMMMFVVVVVVVVVVVQALQSMMNLDLFFNFSLLVPIL